jgi:NAD(P)-dependent dehydrogenase (short-subunit alcohol dehydrogenase family)
MSKLNAIITGGSRGIGYGIAMALAREGRNVLITGRRPAAEVEAARAALAAQGVQAEYFAADVADSEDRKALLAFAKEKFGALHVLVNNAGIAPKVRADILEAGEESFDDLIATNLKGPYFLTQAVANWMVEQRGQSSDFRGTIVNVSSISATVASVNRGDYCLSKAGVAMATRLWAVRLAEYGVGVFEVRPGIIATDMTSGVKGKYDALIESGLLVEKRWGTPEDIGRVVAMLVRGDLSYAPGAVLTLDGGLGLERL